MDVRIEKAQRGDREAMAGLVREHYAAVYRFCARRLGPDPAADATQETFVTAQRSLPRYRSESRFEVWLFGIAHNVCRATARKRRLEPLPLEAWHDPGASPADALLTREELRRALAQLSPDHREVVVLHELEGLRYAEIATILGVPEGTVKSRLHHAFLNLRQMLCGVPK